MSVFRNKIAEADHAAQSTPATTESFVVGEAQSDYVVTDVALVPQGTLTAADAANRTFSLTNTGSNGLGTTVIATLQTNLAGGNWVANDEKAFTLHATVANRNVAAGDVLSCVETVTGAGVAHPAIVLSVYGTAR